jgi:xylose isomerase
VAEALAASRVPSLAQPTLGAGEGWRGLIDADADFDPEEAGARGMNYERLDQLALEHVLGAR